MTNTELKSIRESLDLSKTDFAREIGISPVMEGKYEKGSKEIPETVSQAAYALMNAAEEDTASVADEESVSVTGEEAAPEADEEAVLEADEEAAPEADEEAVPEIAGEAASVTDEEITPAIEAAPAEEETVIPVAGEAAASVMEEAAPSAADEEPAAREISISVIEKTVAVAEGPAEEEKAPAADASLSEDDTYTVSGRPAHIPIFLPPFLMAHCLFNMGFFPWRGRKKGFFRPWW